MSDASHENLIGPAEAARLLETDEERVRVMVDEGLLTPVHEGGGDRFRRSEVMAARQLGG